MKNRFVWKDTPETIIFCNNYEKSEIAKTLAKFNRAKRTSYKSRKYCCSSQLLNYSERNLELSKSDIENSIETDGRSASFASLLAVIFSQWISLSYSNNGKSDPAMVSFVAVLFALVSMYVVTIIAEKATWLHIIKMTLARKTK
jgi:hypothetical protein